MEAIRKEEEEAKRQAEAAAAEAAEVSVVEKGVKGSLAEPGGTASWDEAPKAGEGAEDAWTKAKGKGKGESIGPVHFNLEGPESGVAAPMQIPLADHWANAAFELRASSLGRRTGSNSRPHSTGGSRKILEPGRVVRICPGRSSPRGRGKSRGAEEGLLGAGLGASGAPERDQDQLHGDYLPGP